MQTIQAAIVGLCHASQCPSSLISFCGAIGDFIDNAWLEVRLEVPEHAGKIITLSLFYCELLAAPESKINGKFNGF